MVHYKVTLLMCSLQSKMSELAKHKSYLTGCYFTTIGMTMPNHNNDIQNR